MAAILSRPQCDISESSRYFQPMPLEHDPTRSSMKMPEIARI